MIIWSALLIPVVTAVVLFYRYRHRTKWWEFTIPFAVSVALIFLSKMGTEATQTRDVEFWGGAAKTARYDEPWDEEVPCTHEIACSHPKYCKDTNGRQYQCGTQHSNDGYQHSYDVDHHPARWSVIDTNHIEVPIGEGRFAELAARFGGTRFVDMQRDYHSIDGDRYEADWDGSEDTLEPVTTRHSYENRVAVSSSVFAYPELANPSGLHAYPKIRGHYRMPAILGDGGGESRDRAERVLQLANARLNFMPRQLQIRIFVLLFGPGTDVSTGLDQETLWKGGNKNELVVTMGLGPDGAPEWCHVFSWTKVESLKIDVREAAFESANLADFAERTVELAETSWRRREFAEFDYLTVEPPLWAVLTTLAGTAVVNVLLSWWIVVNQHHEGARLRFGRNFAFRRSGFTTRSTFGRRFTAIELMIVLAIIGILTAVVWSNM